MHLDNTLTARQHNPNPAADGQKKRGSKEAEETLPVRCQISTSRAWAVVGVELRSGVAAGAYLDIPAITAVTLNKAKQSSYLTHFLEPLHDATVVVSSGGGSSGATFY
jgi:hypothetical protein